MNLKIHYSQEISYGEKKHEINYDEKELQSLLNSVGTIKEYD